MRKITLIVLTFISLIFTSCGGTSDCKDLECRDGFSSENISEIDPKFFTKTGKIEKGPFLKDSNITITELDSNLNETAYKHYTKTEDDLGNFIYNGQFRHKFVKLIVTGKYFNEITNAISAEDENLTSIVDITKAETINANVLTTIQSSRIVNLVKNDMTLQSAKTKSKEEFLNTFNLDDINKPLNEIELKNSASLIKVSVIMQDIKSKKSTENIIEYIRDEMGDDGEVGSTLLSIVSNSNKKLQDDKTFTKAVDNLKKRIKDKSDDDFDDDSDDDFDIDDKEFDKDIDTTKKPDKDSSSDNTPPASLKLLPNMSKISAGCYQSLALDDEGYLYTWGSNDKGELGNENIKSSYSKIPTRVGSRKYNAISAGGSNSLAIDISGRLYEWGKSGHFGKIRVPTLKVGNRAFKAVSGGDDFSIAIDESDNIFTWGNRFSGQLGDGKYGIGYLNTPTKISNKKFKSTSAGSSYAVALDKDDKMYIWGNNTLGQLGNGKYNDGSAYLTPKRDYDTSFESLDAGLGHSLGLDENNKLYAWGHNIHGVVGDGRSNNFVTTPKKIGNKTFKAVSAGAYHSIAIDSNNDLYTWGYNAFGQLGNGNGGSVSNRVLIPTAITRGVY